ncbi:hypothetical protein ACOSQ2_019491 [Xanthoceras sorbifolium]
MATANTIIDVQNGKLSKTVLGETVEFEVFDSMKQSLNSFDCFHVDIVDVMVEEEFTKDELEDLLELKRELEEAQRFGSTGAEDDPEIGLGVEEKKKMQTKTQSCPHKSQSSPALMKMDAMKS